MIPKKIHYCWFGGKEKPKSVIKCINSWKKYCLDYEIVEWNENNTDINLIPFVKYAYEAQKYAFVSDVIRLKAVHDYGGIYLDTDVEVIKNLDELLTNDAFIGFENNEFVNTGQIFGAIKGHNMVSQMLDEYLSINDEEYRISFGPYGCPRLNTNALYRNGLEKNGELQTVNGMTIYPADYFNPYDSLTGRVRKTENTYSIHWYAGTWLSKKDIMKSRVGRIVRRISRK